jgi:biopolymer transport protein ExbD
MAAITEGPEILRQRAGVRRAKKHSLKMDLTPMVDLGFLLISFFVITTQLTEPRALRINMPHDGTGTQAPESAALTILIGEANRIFYYHGDWEKAVSNNGIHPTTLDLKTGLGRIIREKQQRLDRNPVNGEDRKGLIIMIKAGEKADYSQVIDVLDEMLINDVRKYAIINPTPEELNFIYARPK